MKRVKAIVRGRVQNVGFRAATAREARRLGLAGSVRNLLDGRVEVEAWGEAAAVDGLVAWLRRGAPPARVTGVDLDESPSGGSSGGLQGFSIR